MTAPNTRIVSWKQALIADDHSPHTIRAYERTIEDCAIWFVDTRRMPFQPEHITAIDGRAYRDDLLTRQLTPATMNQAIAALRHFGTWLVTAQLCTDTPFARLKWIEAAAQHRAPHALTATQINALLREALTTHTPNVIMP